MNGQNRSFEFEASIDESGKIIIPRDIAKEIRNDVVHVRLTAKAIAAELKSHNVNEEEIARIGGLQFESREQVVKFLLSEGVLGNGAVRRRVER